MEELKTVVVDNKTFILCPMCGAILLNRVNSRTGAPFVGCSRFPFCKYVV